MSATGNDRLLAEGIVPLGLVVYERATGIAYVVTERHSESGTIFVEPVCGGEPWSEEWYVAQTLALIACGRFVIQGGASWAA